METTGREWSHRINDELERKHSYSNNFFYRYLPASFHKDCLHKSPNLPYYPHLLALLFVANDGDSGRVRRRSGMGATPREANRP